MITRGLQGFQRILLESLSLKVRGGACFCIFNESLQSHSHYPIPFTLRPVSTRIQHTVGKLRIGIGYHGNAYANHHCVLSNHDFQGDLIGAFGLHSEKLVFPQMLFSHLPPDLVHHVNITILQPAWGIELHFLAVP